MKSPLLATDVRATELMAPPCLLLLGLGVTEKSPHHPPLPDKKFLLVQAHGRALIHAHVSVTEEPSRAALNPSGVQGMQFL